MKQLNWIAAFLLSAGVFSCRLKGQSVTVEEKPQVVSCHSNMPSRFLTKQQVSASASVQESGTLSYTGMVWINGGEYRIGKYGFPLCGG